MTFVDPHAPNESANEESSEALHERVQKRAYQLWEEEGRPNDRAEAHWVQAEQEVVVQPPPQAGVHEPGEDRSQAVAPPTNTQEPGSSAALGGTASATAVDSGRDTAPPRTRSSRSKKR